MWAERKKGGLCWGRKGTGKALGRGERARRFKGMPDHALPLLFTFSLHLSPVSLSPRFPTPPSLSHTSLPLTRRCVPRRAGGAPAPSGGPAVVRQLVQQVTMQGGGGAGVNAGMSDLGTLAMHLCSCLCSSVLTGGD